MTLNLKQAPKYFRAGVARGLATGSAPVEDGGRFGGGLIPGVAVITRGEALGHGVWIDSTFVGQVRDALAAHSEGVKSRFTHPDLSGDGLAKGLGRVFAAEGGNGDTVRGDLHFWRSAANSPEGDLSGFLMRRAAEDPKSFGASITFLHDREAENLFAIENGASVSAGWVDFSTFKSPDPLNVQNLPHARLAELRAVDIVDDPAANPEGLFHRDETLKEAEGLFSYALGLTDRKPEVALFDIDPDRVGGFVRRFLSSKGLELMKKSLNTGAPDDKTTAGAPTDPANPAEGATTPPATPPNGEKEPEAGTPATESPALSEGRKAMKAFAAAFGPELGARYFMEGLTMDEAKSRFAAAQQEALKADVEKLKAENASLAAKLKEAEGKLSAISKEHPRALSSGGADEKTDRGSRSGFASRINLPASRN